MTRHCLDGQWKKEQWRNEFFAGKKRSGTFRFRLALSVAPHPRHWSTEPRPEHKHWANQTELRGQLIMKSLASLMCLRGKPYSLCAPLANPSLPQAPESPKMSDLLKTTLLSSPPGNLTYTNPKWNSRPIIILYKMHSLRPGEVFQ